MSGTTTTTPRSRRSSTNRSTRSVFRQPPWKSSSLTNKNSSTASLSIIVAEPEQGSPLKSASDSVAPLASSSRQNELAKIGLGIQSDQSSDLLTFTGNNNSANSTSLPTIGPVLVVLPQDTIPVAEPLHKSAPLSIPASPQIERQPSFSRSSSSSEGSPPLFDSPVPKTPPSFTPSCVGTAYNSPAETPITIVPTPPSVSSSKGLPTTLDNHVPSLPSHQPMSTPKNPPLELRTASSGRFSIRIPLLGRGKVPLDTVFGLGDRKHKEAPVVPDKVHDTQLHLSTPPSVPSSPPDLPSISPLIQPTTLTAPAEADAQLADIGLSQTETEIATSTTMNATTTTPTLAPSNSTTTSNPNESTWWNYVGWTSTSLPRPTSTSLLPPIDDVVTSTNTSVAIGSEELRPTTSSTDVQNANVTSDMSGGAVSSDSTESKLVNEVEESKSVEPAIEEAKEEVSGGDQRQISLSSPSRWYAPWGWYSSTTAGGPVQPGLQDLEVKSVSEDVQVDVAQDLVPTAVETPEGSVDTLPPPANQPINPITTSMEANWGGWASFLSSRALMVKTLGYGVTDGVNGQDVKRDKDGMEVMDLDDDGGKDLVNVSELGDGGREPISSSSPGRPNVITQTGPLLLKTSNSQDSEISQVELQISGHTSICPSNKPSVPSTPNKGRSGSNTPVPLPPSLSPRDKNQGQPLHNTPSTSTSTKKTDNNRSVSPAPSKKSILSSPPPPNLVLPTWQHTFHTAPRNVVPVNVRPQRFLDDQGLAGKLLGKTVRFVSGVLFSRDAQDGSEGPGGQVKGKEREMSRDDGIEKQVTKGEESFEEYGKELPKAWQILESTTSKGSPVGAGTNGMGEGGAQCEGLPSHETKDVLRGCKRVVVIGIHGWFPGTMLRTVVGEPTGTSIKFANRTEQALHQFEDEHGVKLEKITKIPLEGDGTIDKRVERLYDNLKSNEDWMVDLHEADAIIVSTHSQGSIVSTHLLNRLIQDNHITTAQSRFTTPFGPGAETFPSVIGVPEIIPRRRSKVQRVCCLALCGIHLGPLRYLSSSTLVGPYIQYFESTAARELFEFQNTESAVSKAYVHALQNVLDHGVKMLYIASLNDQVVPLYSGLFTAVSHPLILRALYIDGDAYHSSDFLSNLLVLLIRVLNSGIPDSGLIAHLSEATAGSLIGVGHSTAYEELTTFSLAVKYLFLANDGVTESTGLHVEPFNASQEQNDYEIPWSLRDIIADQRVSHFFSRDIAELRDAFREWHPKTSILRDLKRKLQPITRLPSSSTFNSSGSSISKL